MKRWGWRTLALCAGTLLAAWLLRKATFAAVADLLARTAPFPLFVACCIHGVLVGLRALRLQLLSRGLLSFRRALALFSTAQLGAALLPWRLGELLLPPLARWAGQARLAHGAFWWLAGRFLDLWSLAASVTLLAAAQQLPPWLLLPAGALLLALTVVWYLSPRRRFWRFLARWAPSPGLARGVFRVRHALLAFRRSPGPQLAAVAVSVLGWGAVVGFTATLARGMEAGLAFQQVLLAVLGAAVGAGVPLASMGNLGPLEAGFAGALATTGVAPEAALALGFALHLWTLAFQLAYGLVGVALLASDRAVARQKQG